ncbi:MAG: ATP-binding cassette domain-containing protein [Firmicutes bacterium]|nr:ATP-binding cassette domain-containing protein [Bacillota bacterium]
MIKAVNLSKTYGEQVLFTDVNFTVNPGERVGLVGRNGHGKTTLLRLLSGQELPDSGTLTFPKNYTLGYLDQQLRFSRPTILEEACLGLPAAQKYETWRAEKILLGLGFARADFNRPPVEFSGGFQVRLNLAKLLISEPNLLLLDEPTNYLDITSIRWLVRFLQSWPNEFILVTHDRNFMDQVITHTLGIHRQKIRKMAGNTAKFYAQLAKEEEIYEKTRINEEKKRQATERFINRFRYKATLSSRVQSRIKMLAKKEPLEKLAPLEELEFSFPEAAMPGKIILQAQGLSFSYTGKAPYLIEDFSLTVEKNDRIGIIGKNGKGKTTLLRLLAGELSPHAGSITRHPELKMGYFGQTNIERLAPDRTILEELESTSPDCTLQQARKISGAFMFSGDLALKKIRVLSGGEKSRVLLGKLLVSPSNLLLLDEPTNHLDMESGDSLLEALDAYNGALLIVTHNELYLHALVNKLIVFDQDKVAVFNGSYQRFLEEIGWESERDEPSLNQKASAARQPTNQRKALRREKAAIITRKSMVLRPLESTLGQLEKAITARENELQTNNEQLVAASTAGDGETIARLAKRNAELNAEIEQLYTELVKCTEEYEQAARQFEEELKKIETV